MAVVVLVVGRLPGGRSGLTLSCSVCGPPWGRQDVSSERWVRAVRSMGDSRRTSLLDILRGRNKESKRDLTHHHQATIERWDTETGSGQGLRHYCCCSVSTFPSASQSALSRCWSLSSWTVQLLSLQCWNFVFWRSNFNEIHNHKCSQLMKTIYGTKTNLKDLMWRNKILLRTNLWKSNQIQPRLGCLVNCVKYISDHSRI